MLENIEKLLKSIKSKINTLPSIRVQTLPAVKTPDVPKIPGMPSASKKSPVKVAEQIKNKDIKDDKMKEAIEHVKINKSNGQWSLS